MNWHKYMRYCVNELLLYRKLFCVFIISVSCVIQSRHVHVVTGGGDPLFLAAHNFSKIFDIEMASSWEGIDPFFSHLTTIFLKFSYWKSKLTNFITFWENVKMKRKKNDSEIEVSSVHYPSPSPKFGFLWFWSFPPPFFLPPPPFFLTPPPLPHTHTLRNNATRV